MGFVYDAPNSNFAGTVHTSATMDSAIESTMLMGGLAKHTTLRYSQCASTAAFKPIRLIESVNCIVLPSCANSTKSDFSKYPL